MLLTVKDLTRRGTSPQPIRFLDTRSFLGPLPENGYGSSKAPSEYVVITRAEPYARHDDKELIKLTVAPASQFGQNEFYLYSDTAIMIPNADICEQLMSSYFDYVRENLHHNLHHSCLLGADPEIFVKNRDGKVIPAFDFLGSKHKPEQATSKPNGTNSYNQAYWDGFQAEFTVDAGTCLGYRVDSVQTGLEVVLKAARKHDASATLSLQNTLSISREELAAAKEEHVAFGCMPSFNAYGLKGELTNGRETQLRSAGGHIHFGYHSARERPRGEEADRIVKALDAVLGVACVSLFEGIDSPLRRRFYGMAGEYRLPPHGLEYRVLSNAWLSHPLVMNLVFDLGRKVMVLGQKGLGHLWKVDQQETIDCIQNCDVASARKIMSRNKDMLLQILKSAYYEDNRAKGALKAFMEGINSFILKPEDIEGNWALLKGTYCPHNGMEEWNVAKSHTRILKGIKAA